MYTGNAMTNQANFLLTERASSSSVAGRGAGRSGAAARPLRLPLQRGSLQRDAAGLGICVVLEGEVKLSINPAMATA